MDMTYRPLGHSGLMVSAVGIGCNAFSRRVDQDGVGAILDAAEDAGVTLLDTADIYGGEPGRERGAARRTHCEGRRDEFVVATKFGMDMQGANGADHGVRGSRRYVRRAVEASLRRLQTDHIDLYQLHAPDPVTPIDETLAALTELVREGKVRYVGCSNFGGWQVADAAWTAETKGLEHFVSAQNRYSLLDRDGRGRGDPGVRAVRPRRAAVLPAGVRPAHRQVPSRRGRPRGLARALDPSRARWLAAADWDRIEALEAYAAAARPRACSTSRSPGSRPSRPWPSVISGRHRRASRCRPTRPPCGGSRPPRTWPSCSALRSPTPDVITLVGPAGQAR